MTATRAFVYLDNPAQFLPLDGAVPTAPTPPGTYPATYGAIGAYRPSATTTGIPAGTTLTTIGPSQTFTATSGQILTTSAAGDLVITVANVTLDSLDLHVRVVVKAANCTIQRCIVRGPASIAVNTACIDATNGAVFTLLVQDCVLVPQTPSIWLNGLSGHDFTMLRTEIRDVVDPIGTWNSALPGRDLKVRIEQNWFHSIAYFTPDVNHSSDNQTHNDGTQIQGGLNCIYRGNSVESYYGPNGSGQPSNTGPTPSGWPNPSLSCILFNNNVGVTGAHIIEDNWLMGAYIPVNCGGAPGRDLGRMWRNRFSGDSLTPSGGVPHTITLRSDQTCDTGDGTANQNVFDDTGAAVLVRHNG
jgi:hypothetical protein